MRFYWQMMQSVIDFNSFDPDLYVVKKREWLHAERDFTPGNKNFTSSSKYILSESSSYEWVSSHKMSCPENFFYFTISLLIKCRSTTTLITIES